MEMRYFVLLDKEAQSEFELYYHPGQENLGDYHTKAFTAKDTNISGPFYVHIKHYPQTLFRALIPSLRQGCVVNISIPYVHRRPLPMLPRVITQVPAVVVA